MAAQRRSAEMQTVVAIEQQDLFKIYLFILIEG